MTSYKQQNTISVLQHKFKIYFLPHFFISYHFLKLAVSNSPTSVFRMFDQVSLVSPALRGFFTTAPPGKLRGTPMKIQCGWHLWWWLHFRRKYPSVQFSSVAQSCQTLCNPMNRSTSGLPVHHQLPESTQTHVHWVGDAIQPSHPLSSPSSLALNLSRIRVFSNESVLCIRWPKYWVSATTSVPPINTQDWSPLGWTGWISLQSKGLSRVFSNTTVQEHQFFTQFSF